MSFFSPENETSPEHHNRMVMPPPAPKKRRLHRHLFIDDEAQEDEHVGDGPVDFSGLEESQWPIMM